MSFYVYHYCDPDSGIPFYVGKGYGNRAYKHLTECKRSSHVCFNNIFYRKLRKMLSEGVKPDIEIVMDQLEEKEAFDLEKALIKSIGRRDQSKGPLTNLTDGGEGMSGWIPSKEIRQQMRVRNLGKVLSVGTKQRIREARLGGKHTEESKQRMRAHSPVTHYRRAVIASDTHGKQLYQFDSIKSVIAKDFNPSGVSHCLAGRQKTYKGLFWRYSDA